MSQYFQSENESLSSGPERQIVAFSLNRETYGVDIAQVNTVLTMTHITPVPSSPAHIRGVMNLRGKILPVVDLRKRIGIPAPSAEQEAEGRIMIVEVDGAAAGLLVDSVSEVLRIPEERIERACDVLASSTVDLNFIAGVARMPAKDAKKQAERLILLLDIEPILSVNEAKEAA